MEDPLTGIGYQGARRAERGVAAPAGSSDAPPSNRASDSCIDVLFRPLSLHVDSLEVSYRGTLRDGVANRLEGLKQLAQNPDPAEQARAQLIVGDETFLVHDKGAPLFPFVLENGAFYIKLAERSENSPLPCVYCQFRSEYLVQTGPLQAESEVREVLRELVLLGGVDTVSRIDPAVDFVTDVNMEGWSRRSWVTRLRRKTSNSDGEQFTGWRIGTHRNPVSLRLYDKTHELSKSNGKAYLHEIWEKAGHMVSDN